MKTVLEVSTLMLRQVSTYTCCTSYTRAMAVVGASLQAAPLFPFTWYLYHIHGIVLNNTWHFIILTYIYIYIYAGK